MSVRCVLAGHYDPSFPIALCLKDLDLIDELMTETGTRNDLIRAAHERFGEAGEERARAFAPEPPDSPAQSRHSPGFAGRPGGGIRTAREERTFAGTRARWFRCRPMRRRQAGSGGKLKSGRARMASTPPRRSIRAR